MSKGPLSYPIPFWVSGPLALFAGCAAMLFVLAQLGRFAVLHGFGIAPQSTVLGVFVAGLALGALVVGLRGDASRHPLRWFGALQVGLGVFALCASTIDGLLAGAPLLGHAAAMMLLPGLLLGGSLAMLVRASAHTTERGALALGTALALTAFGAAAAFFLRGATGILAPALPIAFGAAAWGLSTAAGARERFGSDGEHIRIAWTGDAGFPVLFGLVVVGAILPLQRFAWNRLLPFALDGGAAGGADPAATGFLLHLAGLGLGAVLGTLLVSGGHNARRLLARVLLGASVLTGAPLFYGDAFLGGGGFVSAALLVLPGAVGCGLILPLVAHVALSDRESLARQGGAMLALLGSGWAISLLFFVPRLLDTLTSTDLIVVSSVALLAGGTVIGFGKGLREWIPAGSATLLVVLVVLGGTRTDALAARMAAVRDDAAPRRVVGERQSATATYAGVESLRDGTRRLYRNGLTGEPAGQFVPGYRMVGHLPALLHPGAKRALVARFGTGTVAGALAQHPHLERIDVVAEDEAPFELAASFAAANRDVLADPRVRRHVGELRPFVRETARGYDILVLEPEAAASRRGRLPYTEGFFASARKALRPGGLLCERLPTETYGAELLQRVVRAANEHFAFVTLWDFADGLLLLASDKAPELEAQALLLRFSKVGPDLQEARVAALPHLFGSLLCRGAVFAPKSDVEPLRDDSVPEFAVAGDDGRRAMLARVGASPAASEGRAWAKGLAPGLEEVAARTQALRELRADAAVSADKLQALADQDRADLRLRAAAEECRYEERLQKGDFAGAARLSLVRDRTAALRGMVDSLEGERRDYYSILLLREGVAVPATELDRLAGRLDGAERRYVANRARLLRGEAAEAGEEKRPDVQLRDPTEALAAWDEDTLREDVLDAECGLRQPEFDAVVLAWFEACEDQQRAVLMLHRVGWGQSLRVARKLAGRQIRDDLVALAPVFASAYPDDRTWSRLCESSEEEVRAAAAEAARAHGGAAHVEDLKRLCGDGSASVRMGAYQSLESILGAEKLQATGYDPEKPEPAALEKLRALR